MPYYLIEQIIKYTKSEHSINFYRKAIKLLGEGRVEMELGELKHQLRIGTVKDPARYFTKLLLDQLNQLNIPTEDKPLPPNDTYQELTQEDLFRHLVPRYIPKDSKSKNHDMPLPYRKAQIPFPTFIGHEFFALTNNKLLHDKIRFQSIAADGETVTALLIRGKSKPSAKAWGIPTTTHGKLLMALIQSWTDKNCDSIKLEDGTIICTLKIKAKDLALKYLKWEKFGGSQARELHNHLEGLSKMPYCLLPENKGTYIDHVGFTLLGDVRNIDIKDKKGRFQDTVYEIHFSTTLSWQLYNRHVLTRADNFITIKNDIAWKLKLYLEPRLLSTDYYHRNLKKLIKDLQLPNAKWHEKMYERKRYFLKSVKELNNSVLSNKHILKLKIILNKSKTDYKLVAAAADTKQQVLNV